MNVTFAPALTHKIVHLNTEKHIKKKFKKTSKKICQRSKRDYLCTPQEDKSSDKY